ncbi:MAG: flagellar basal body rod protein FlgF [Gammaproteobacteria bacterium]|nr:flagellar basal body rod protein FlgF [Gammaproteobacteria bacterium]
MDKLIYVAMSGAREAMRAQATTSHNLANLSTTGFRALRNILDSAPIPGAGLPSRVNTVREPELWNSRQGPSQATGRELDISIQGQGWLVVQDEDGNDAYTRAGDLRINTNGILETAAGLPVRGNGGPVSIPPYEKLFIGDDGQISIVPQGQTAESLVQVDRLRLVNPPALDLVRSGNGLFSLRDGSAAVPDPAVRVASGQLESSNVNPAEALAEMIEMSRHYEMQVRAMNTADELDSASARLIRMNG